MQLEKDIIKINNVIAEYDILKQEFDDLMSTKINKHEILAATKADINDEIECEIADEAFETLTMVIKSRNSYRSQDGGFQSISNSNSEDNSYPEELNPSSVDNYANSQAAINGNKSSSLKI